MILVDDHEEYKLHETFSNDEPILRDNPKNKVIIIMLN